MAALLLCIPRDTHMGRRGAKGSVQKLLHDRLVVLQVLCTHGFKIPAGLTEVAVDVAGLAGGPVSATARGSRASCKHIRQFRVLVCVALELLLYFHVAGRAMVVGLKISSAELDYRQVEPVMRANPSSSHCLAYDHLPFLRDLIGQSGDLSSNVRALIGIVPDVHSSINYLGPCGLDR
eukprot:1359754-Amorphochlora_amoeboformis.AAC.1